MIDDDFLLLSHIENSASLIQFFSECADQLVGKKGPIYENYIKDANWDKDAFERVKKYIQDIFHQQGGQEKLQIQLSALPDSLKAAIEHCFEMKKDVLYQAQAKEALLKRGCNLVENIDWKLKWILGSSDLASLREVLLQIDFYSIKNVAGQTDRRITSFEANLEQVDNMIKELTRIKQEFD